MKLHKSIIIFVFLVCGCSAPIKNYTNSLYVNSTSYKFIDELLKPDNEQDSSVELLVWVSLPDPVKFQAPYPAVVLLHSSWGLSSQESFYSKVFADMGIAVYVIDSFSPRGVGKTSLDQSLVSSASMIQDAYQVLNYLQNLPEINNKKIAVMGFSKGGIAAFYSAFDEIKSAVSENKDAMFAAHVAYYPWCGIRLQNMKTTSKPILIQGGGKDTITPVEKCVQLAEEELSVEEKYFVAIKTHINARHAFDHPLLSKIPIPISLNAQVPGLCEIQQNENGSFIETYKEIEVTSRNIKTVLENCSTFNGVAGYNDDASQAALIITQQFLSRYLLQ
ncbi:MAG: dienelactone hydrolase family protein [Gammaproteobacteria bacterium]